MTLPLNNKSERLALAIADARKFTQEELARGREVPALKSGDRRALTRNPNNGDKL
jgi:hypothetical protein